MTPLFFVISILLTVAAVGVLIIFFFIALRQKARMARSLDVQMLQVLLPKDLETQEREEGIGESIKERIAVAEQFLSTLVAVRSTVFERFMYGPPVLVFEIVARPNGGIVFYAGTERKYIDHLEKQIYAHYPEAEVTVAKEYTTFHEQDTILVAALALRKKNYLPIATYKELEVDPMQALTGALAKIQDTDAAMIQYVFCVASKKEQRRAQVAASRTIKGKQADIASSSFSMSTLRSALVTSQADRDRKEQRASQITPRMQQRVDLVEAKMAEQQFLVNIRVVVAVHDSTDAERVFQAIISSFAQYDLPDLNQLRVRVPPNKKKFLEQMIFRVPNTQKASVLSTTELASLYHFPLPTTATPNIIWRGAKAAPAPGGIPTSGVLLGNNIYRGIETPVYLAESDRRRHLYLIGQTGTGKTTMFLNMIVQDIQAGHGVGVIDPHGDLIEEILQHIPQERAKDVVLFDPRDKDMPLGFNILEAKDSNQKDLIVNEVVQILQKLAARLNPESIGPMFEHYLRNALLALVEDENSTLLDVPRMLVDEKFRNAIIAKNTNPTVLQFWQQEFAQSQRGQMSADMLSYVISKLGRFISNETVRNIIGQAKSSFDVREVMDNQKILLCNLSKGQLGDINSDLLGFVLVSKIQIAALGRANMPEHQRKDFYLYLDEFQNFTTDSIATILSEARKYKLNLNLTHQFIKQLDDPIRDAVFGNVGTILSYRIGVEDGEFMEKQFAPVFTQYDLVNLHRFTAVIRLLANGTPERSFSLSGAMPPQHGNPEVADVVRANSRREYGRSKNAVEMDILGRFQTKPVINTDQKPNNDYHSESLFDIG
ncbi:MAG: type IV secretion system DNA-binding domain-containing protein [bacterium]|nr:type IV secretion system DNA-binding domain-containing protein [bacterium]